GEILVKARVDVDVVVLDGRQHADLRLIVQKLGGLLEKCRIVLVTLDHEGGPPLHRGKARELFRVLGSGPPKTVRQVVGNATNQEAWRKPRAIEQVGTQRTGRGLAM